jgi:hypothetical protein
LKKFQYDSPTVTDAHHQGELPVQCELTFEFSPLAICHTNIRHTRAHTHARALKPTYVYKCDLNLNINACYSAIYVDGGCSIFQYK